MRFDVGRLCRSNKSLYYTNIVRKEHINKHLLICKKKKTVSEFQFINFNQLISASNK